MKKTLVIVTHPHIDQSVVNKRWVEELEKHPDQFMVHQIYQAYPDGMIDVAKEQAESYGHSFERELGFLALHGFLHLLGYDHMNDNDEKEMFGRQDAILNEFGLTRN